MACRTASLPGLDKTLINRVTSSDLLQPGKRPAKTGLAIDKARVQLEFDPLSFKEGLKIFFPENIISALQKFFHRQEWLLPPDFLQEE